MGVMQKVESKSKSQKRKAKTEDKGRRKRKIYIKESVFDHVTSKRIIDLV